jgi:hypothetical protein
MDREQAIHALIQNVISTPCLGTMEREQADRLALTINAAAQANLIRVAEAVAEWCLGMYGIEEV